jgi:hypothetical protein
VKTAAVLYSVQDERTFFPATQFTKEYAGTNLNIAKSPGVHADVGGDNAAQPNISALTLRWMAQESADAGSAVNMNTKVDGRLIVISKEDYVRIAGMTGDEFSAPDWAPRAGYMDNTHYSTNPAYAARVASPLGGPLVWAAADYAFWNQQRDGLKVRNLSWVHDTVFDLYSEIPKRAWQGYLMNQRANSEGNGFK